MRPAEASANANARTASDQHQAHATTLNNATPATALAILAAALLVFTLAFLR